MLDQLYLGNSTGTYNTFEGPLPASMSNLVNVEFLELYGKLTGPIPDFSRLTQLKECSLQPSQLCRIPKFVPANSLCDFSVLPECITIPDCLILANWLPDRFSRYFCFQEGGVTCVSDNIVILDLSREVSVKSIFGLIPSSIGGLLMLQRLYLQGNLLEGNLPFSISKISSLQTVDISNNLLSGVLTFVPLFNLIGIETNLDLSLADASAQTETPAEVGPDSTSAPLTLIVGACVATVTIALLAALIVLFVGRRRLGKETDFELKIYPKYSSMSKKIRLLRLLNSGGFGVVWKARFQGEVVAIKLIRTEKIDRKDNKRNVKLAKMVADEASVMEIMVHERIVRFIMFEIESIGIVLEYLPLGSLYDHIEKAKGVMPWKDRHQLMLDICEGMEFLHSNVYSDGRVKQVLFHQDLKSGNVLLCMEGTPAALRGKISDFGLSCKSPHPNTI
jgi:hypothetical protein